MRLPANLDLAAATPLKAAFLGARGQALELEAGSVERLGALCLQVILAAHAQWRADGVAFSIVNASAAFAEAMQITGAGEIFAEAM